MPTQAPDLTAQFKPACQGERCADFDGDCARVFDKLACWKRNPELGVCPYLSGELQTADAR